ncbi:hypothetical protein [Coleofasciculus chthonoplastes]
MTISTVNFYCLHLLNSNGIALFLSKHQDLIDCFFAIARIQSTTFAIS